MRTVRIGLYYSCHSSGGFAFVSAKNCDKRRRLSKYQQETVTERCQARSIINARRIIGTGAVPWRVRIILHCKNIHTSMDISWRVFRILTELVHYTFVSVNRRNNEARAHIAMWSSPDLGLLIPSIYRYKNRFR